MNSGSPVLLDKPLLVLLPPFAAIVVLLTPICCPCSTHIILANVDSTSTSHLTIPRWWSLGITAHLWRGTVLMIVLIVAACHCLTIRIRCSLTTSLVAAIYQGAFLRSSTRRCTTLVSLLCLLWGLWRKFCELGVCVEVASSHLWEGLSFEFHLISSTLDCSNRLCYAVRCWEELFKQSSHMLWTMFNHLSLHHIICLIIRFLSSTTRLLLITTWYHHTLRQSNALGPNQDPDYISTHQFFTLRQHLSFLLWIGLWALLQLFQVPIDVVFNLLLETFHFFDVVDFGFVKKLKVL